MVAGRKSTSVLAAVVCLAGRWTFASHSSAFVQLPESRSAGQAVPERPVVYRLASGRPTSTRGASWSATASSAKEPESESRSFASTLTGAAVMVAAAAGWAYAPSSQAGTPRTVCFLEKRYGGNVKKVRSVAFHPQYNGKMDFQIAHGARIGKSKQGQGRVIPRLSGDSYDRRKAMMRALTTEVLRHGRIKTTYSRAIAVQSFVDRMIVLAKRGDDLARREADEWIYDEELVDSLFQAVPDRYDADQNSDFTRVIRTMHRKGDGAPMAYIDLID